MAWQLDIDGATPDGDGRVPRVDVIDPQSGAVIGALALAPIDIPDWDPALSVGPSKVTANVENDLQGLRLDGGAHLVAEDPLPMGDAGTFVAYFHVPAGWGLIPPEAAGDAVTVLPGMSVSSFHDGFAALTFSTVVEDEFLGTGKLFYAGAPNASSVEHFIPGTVPTASSQWHMIAMTWDISAGDYMLYLDGEYVAESEQQWGGDEAYPARISIQANDHVFYTRQLDGLVAPTLVRLEALDAAFGATEIAAKWAEFLTVTPGGGGDGDGGEPGGGEPGGGSLRWAGTVASDLSGWVLRLAVDGVVDEVQLPADVRYYDVWSHYNSSTVHGIAHLHAVNGAGRSAPAEVEF